MDAVCRAILDGLVDLILGECTQIGHLDEAGFVHVKDRRTGLDANLAANALAELHNRSFHGSNGIECAAPESDERCRGR
jgi:hypothetical protein